MATWFAAFIALLMGLLAFAGESAVSAIFALGVAGQYIAYAVPIASRFIFKNDFKPGPFFLGRLVSIFTFISRTLAFLPYR